MKDTEETSVTELDLQGMAHDLKVLPSINYRTVYHLLYGNPAPRGTWDGTAHNAC